MCHAVDLMLRRALADPPDPDPAFGVGAVAESELPETPEPTQSAPKRRLSSPPPGMRRSSSPPPSSPDRVDLAWLQQIFANIKL